MASTLTEKVTTARAPGRLQTLGDAPWYVGAVVFGAVLMVIAAINQPYNQNELKQMGPYDSNDLSEIASGTRQPPLDPWLGALVQHLLGEGQVRQRLVPIVASIGSLIFMSLLLRRLRLGFAGAIALWAMATAPLLVRYTAYTRPYALPLFFMILFVYAVQRWLDDRSKAWLAVAAVSAAVLPLCRVPEPVLFLVTTAATLTLFAARGRLTPRQAWPPVAVVIAALAFVGYPMFRQLSAETPNVWDPSLSGIIDRFPSGVDEMFTGFMPTFASWLPWWPITVAMIVATLVLPAARRRLVGWWFFWPLLAAPILFLLAYHFANPYPFESRPYRIRMAIFFVPGFVLIVAALACALTDLKKQERKLRIFLGVLLAAVLIGQLPATARVLVENEAADFGQVAEVLTEDLPDDAIVLFDALSPTGRWHQPFTADGRYMGDNPSTHEVSHLMDMTKAVPQHGPVYFLLLDSECGPSVVCDEKSADWNGEVPGWRVKTRFDRFTLYEPITPLSGREGVMQATLAFGLSLGPDYGSREIFSAAAMLGRLGRPEEGKALIRELYDRASADPGVERRIHAAEKNKGWDPFP